MPIQKKEVTFLGWLDELFKLPMTLPRQTIAVAYDNAKKDLLFLRVTQGPPKGDTSSNLRIALAEGAEEVRDIIGVNIVVQQTDLAIKPLATIGKILSDTANDIANIDEISSMRRGKVIGNLTKGLIENEEQKELTKPDNLVLKALGFKSPFELGQTGKSVIQLLVDKSPPNSAHADYEDRLDFETGTSTPTQLQSYKGLSASITQLAETAEARSPRLTSRDNALQEFNRTIIRELNLPIGEVLEWKDSKGATHGGRLKAALIAANGDISAITGNNALIDQIFTLQTGTIDQLDVHTQKYIKKFIEAESLGMKVNADPILHQQIQQQMQTQLRLPIQQTASGSINFTGGLGFSNSKLEDEIKKQWTEFSKPGAKAEDRVKAFDNLRRSYLKGGRTIEWFKIESMDFGLKINSSRYGGVNSKKLYADDLKFEQQKALIENQIYFELYQSEIRRDIVNRIRANPRLQSQANILRAARSANYINSGMNASAAVQQADEDVNQFWQDHTSKTIERLSAARNSAELANDMFFSATTKEILENIDSRKFVQTGFILSRFFAGAPFVDKRYRDLISYTKFIDPRTYTNEINKTVAKKLSLVYEDNVNSGILGAVAKGIGAPELGIENRFWIQHQHYKTSTQGQTAGKLVPSDNWSTVLVKHKDIAGLFDGAEDGQFSLFTLLNNLEDADLLSQYNLTPEYFLDANNLALLKSALQQVRGTGANFVPLTPITRILVDLGLNDPAGTANIDKFITNIDKALDPQSGVLAWLQKLDADGKVPKAEWWRFIRSIVKSGKSASLTKRYIGILTLYSRAANGIRDFFIRSVLWGDFMSRVPGVNPLRNFARTLGFSDEPGLILRLQRWRPIANLRAKGLNLLKFAQGAGNASRLGSILARMPYSQALMKSIGLIAKSFAGIASGGIAWALSLLSGTVWKASKRLLRLDLRGAVKAVQDDVKSFLNVVAKIIGYPIRAILYGCACCCIAPPLLILIFLTVVIGGMFTEYGDMGGGAADQFASKKISINKNAVYTESENKIAYQITINNLTDEPVILSDFKDELKQIPECSVNKGIAVEYGNEGFQGETNPANIFVNIFEGQEINPGVPFSINYELLNVSSDSTTYVNNVRAAVQNDGGLFVSDSQTIEIGDGGCALCPTGWPLDNFCVTQGPGAAHSHLTSEAMDFGSISTGTSVKATHAGIATVVFSGTGYGNHVYVKEPNLGYRTIYAHLSFISVETGDTVNAGTILGGAGNTGNSDGTHLHYEIEKPLISCNGIPLRLDPPFIPDTGKSFRGCDSGTCNYCQ